MENHDRFMVLGHTGLVGSAIVSELKNQQYKDVVTVSKTVLDLTDFKQTISAFKYYKPTYVISAAARSGGMYAHQNMGACFLKENLQIDTNVIEACRQVNVKKLINIGNHCVYSENLYEPIKESHFMMGHVDENDIVCATSKFASIKLCQLYNKQYGCNYVSVIPSNIYGPHDNFDPINSHVIPSMLMKFTKAKIYKEKSVMLWGDGSPLRELTFSKDVAQAILLVCEKYDSPDIINIGSGFEISIKDLALMVKDMIGYDGIVEWNEHYHNGAARKLLNVEKINDMGWQAKTNLSNGIKLTYDWFLKNYYNLRKR